MLEGLSLVLSSRPWAEKREENSWKKKALLASMLWSSLSKSGSISRLLIGKQQPATLWSLSQPASSFLSEAASASKDTQLLKQPLKRAIDYLPFCVLSRSGISTRSGNMSSLRGPASKLSSRGLTSEDKGSMGAAASRS